MSWVRRCISVEMRCEWIEERGGQRCWIEKENAGMFAHVSQLVVKEWEGGSGGGEVIYRNQILEKKTTEALSNIKIELYIVL